MEPNCTDAKYCVSTDPNCTDAKFCVSTEPNCTDAKYCVSTGIRLYPRQQMSAVVVIDPISGRRGLAHSVNSAIVINTRLMPGQSLLVRPQSTGDESLPLWRELTTVDALEFNGNVKVEFLSGGPSLPSAYSTDEIAYWSARDGQEYRDFSGTARYSFEMNWNGKKCEEVLLEFANICASARVTINGSYAGTIWCMPYHLYIGKYLQTGSNKIEVEVTNTAANRISAMDRAGTEWRIYGDINFVNIHYKPFDASTWETTPSGIDGTVRLVGVV